MSQTSLAERGWLSVKDAAAYVGVAPEVVTRAIVRGELDAYVKPQTRRAMGERLRYRVSREDVDEWMRSQPSAREAILGVG